MFCAHKADTDDNSDDGKQEVDLGLAEKCFVDFVGSDAEDVEYLNFDEDLDDGYME